MKIRTGRTLVIFANEGCQNRFSVQLCASNVDTPIVLHQPRRSIVLCLTLFLLGTTVVFTPLSAGPDASFTQEQHSADTTRLSETEPKTTSTAPNVPSKLPSKITGVPVSAKKTASISIDPYRAQRVANGDWSVPTERLGAAPSITLLDGISANIDVLAPLGQRILETTGQLVLTQAGSTVATDSREFTGRDRSISVLEGESLVATSPALEVRKCEAKPRSVALVTNLRSTLRGPGNQPTTLADFFPEILDDVEIELPKRMTRAMAIAVLATVTGISRRRERAPRLHLVVPNSTAIQGPFRRRIAFVQDPKAELRLREVGGLSAPILEVRGDGNGLVSAGRLAGREQLLAFSTPALQIDPDLSYERAKRSTDSFAFADVAQGRLEVEGETPASLTWTIHQADLGGPLKDLTVNLVGRAQTIGTDFGLEVRLLIDGRPVDSIKLEAGGPFELSTKLPFKDRSFALRRESVVSVESRVLRPAPPAGTSCFPSEVVRLSVDGNVSTVKATVANNDLLGFERFPQAFSRGVLVRFGSLTPSSVVESGQVLSSMWTGRKATFDPLIEVELDEARSPSQRSAGSAGSAGSERLQPSRDLANAKLARIVVINEDEIESGLSNVELDGVGAVATAQRDKSTLSIQRVAGRDVLEVALGSGEPEIQDVLHVKSFAALEGDLAVASANGFTAVWTSRTPRSIPMVDPALDTASQPRGLSRFGSLGVGVVMSLAIVLALVAVATSLKVARSLFRRR